MVKRILDRTYFSDENMFLFGARQTGKTSLLLELFPEAKFYDLLENNTYERLQRNPSLLRQDLEMCEEGTLVIIDEVQLIPALLNEIQWLIVRKNRAVQAHANCAVQNHRVADDGRGVPKKSCRHEQGRTQVDGFQGGTMWSC